MKTTISILPVEENKSASVLTNLILKVWLKAKDMQNAIELEIKDYFYIGR